MAQKTLPETGLGGVHAVHHALREALVAVESRLKSHPAAVPSQHLLQTAAACEQLCSELRQALTSETNRPPLPHNADDNIFALLELPYDAISRIATFLRPDERLSLALTSRRVFEIVWPTSFASYSGWSHLTPHQDVECSTAVRTRFIFHCAVSRFGNRVAYIDEIDSSGSTLAKRIRGEARTQQSAEVTCGFLGRLNVWDVEKRTIRSLSICRKNLPRSWRCLVTGLEFSVDGKFVAVAGEHLFPPEYQHSVGLFLVEKARGLVETTLVLKRKLYPHTSGISCVAFSPDNVHLACASRTGNLDVFLYKENILQRTMMVREAHDQFNVEQLNVTYSPGGDFLISTLFNSAQQRVAFVVWNPTNGTRLRTLYLPNDSGSLFARSIPSISCDGARVALTRDGFHPKTIAREVWNLTTNEPEYSVTESTIPSRGVIPYRKIQTMTCRFASSKYGGRLLLFSSSKGATDSDVSRVCLEAINVETGKVVQHFPFESAQLTFPKDAPELLQNEDSLHPGIDRWVADATSTDGKWAVVVTETGKVSAGRLRPYKISVRNVRLSL